MKPNSEKARAEQVWAAAHTDAALLAALRLAYPHGDVLDALWWRAHPLTPTPDGLPDPAAALSALQAAVYSRPAASAPPIDRDDVDRLRALERQLAAYDRALDVVLDSALDAARVGSALAEPDNGFLTSVTAAVTTPEAAAASPYRRGRRAALLAAAVLLGVGVTIGVQAVASPPGQISVAPSPSPTVDRENLLHVFSYPSEYPVIDLGPTYRSDSVRNHTTSDPDAVGFGIYFAQRASDQLYCLVVQNADTTGSAACDTNDGIRKSGLQLRVVVDVLAPMAYTSEVGLTDVTITLSPTGVLTTDFDPRVIL